MYNGQFGHDYLHTVVGTFVELAHKKYLKKIDTSLLQSSDADPAERERTGRQIHNIFAHFLDFLLGTAASIPKEIVDVTQSIAQTVGDKFGQRSGDTFVSGYFFLRFLCPSLATPATTMQCDISSSGHKLFILLSRILQASVNNQEFENENMRFANEIIRASQNQIGTFFSCMRKGSFEGEEAIEIASARIRKELKKYRSKCPRGDCGRNDVFSQEDTRDYFISFFQTHTFAVRKKIKFESGFSRGEDAPVIVSLSLANLKLLQAYFRNLESPASASPPLNGSVPMSLAKARDSPLNRVRVTSSADSGGPQSPRKYKSSPLINDALIHNPHVQVVRNVKVTRESSEKVKKTNSFEKGSPVSVSKTNSDFTAQFHLKLGYE